MDNSLLWESCLVDCEMFLTPLLLYSWDGNIISSPKFENWRFLLEFPNATWLLCVCCGVVSVLFEKDCFVVHSCPDKLLLLIEISNPLKPEDAGEKEGIIRARFCMPPYERVQGGTGHLSSL